MKTKKCTFGFTLIELIVVMSIAAILVAIAVPSMESTIQKSTVKSLQGQYLRALNYARDEAVTRNKRVSMCPSEDGQSCDVSQNNWSGGWLIFIDDGLGFGNGVYEPDETLLRIYESGGNSSVVAYDQQENNLSSISWNYRGFASGTFSDAVINEDSATLPATFVVCGRQDDVSFARGVLVQRSGRAVTTRDWDDDGIHESVYDSQSGIGNTLLDLSCS